MPSGGGQQPPSGYSSLQLPSPPAPSYSLPHHRRSSTNTTSLSAIAIFRTTPSASSPLTTFVKPLRWCILLQAIICLVLDILSISLPQSSPTYLSISTLLSIQTGLPDEVAIPALLCPDILAIALMSLLLWNQTRWPWSQPPSDTLPSSNPTPSGPCRRHHDDYCCCCCHGCYQISSRAHHAVVRTLLTLVLVSTALVEPLIEAHHFWSLGSNPSTEPIPFTYLCQPGPRSSPDLVGTTFSTCALLRARSIMAFVWTALAAIELLVAFGSRELSWVAQGPRVVGGRIVAKTDLFSTSEIWEEVLEVGVCGYDEEMGPMLVNESVTVATTRASVEEEEEEERERRERESCMAIHAQRTPPLSESIVPLTPVKIPIPCHTSGPAR